MAIIEELLAQLQADGIGQIQQQIGLGRVETERAVGAALPAILAGLASNTGKSADGAAALVAALDRDHDGSVLDDLAGFLGGGGAASQGSSILEHVFGGRRSRVESGLGRAGGLDPQAMAQVMALLAPLVLGMLGKMRRQQGLSPGELASRLGSERSRLEQRSGPGMDILGKMLDADGDGSVIDDLMEKGGGLLGSLFGSR